jgi:hypothetical protein
MKKKRNVIKSYTIELDLIHALNVPLQKHLMEAFSSLEPVLMECHKRMNTHFCLSFVINGEILSHIELSWPTV